ncbi:nucleotidyltransferase domain-containing protein [Arcobacter sp. FWKO B]|uniref:nucleotidyltransferase domain-containing protein n=1 Tax=Arcobacter sp. FWKO B TaxID=2593672 RepID=UPI0018A4F836|nr:nucleotidyltransferase domain-containing protein [Arcobacter sp. FWKO B]QOG12243.1 nucleotidyltransferase domain-containing protein [Arcobacter sp. FWKO B]
MRLSQKVVNILQENIIKSFGNVNIYLFGSRTDDTKKGGDIDLAIDVDLSKEEFRKKKSLLLSLLTRIDFAYKIDVVNFNTKDALLYKEIRRNHIKLNC